MIAPRRSTSFRSSGIGVCIDILTRQGVGLLVGCDLPQAQTEVARPEADRMECAQPLALVVTPPQRLAIDGEHRPIDAGCHCSRLAQRLQPADEADLKCLGLQGRQHAPKDILARHPVGQCSSFVRSSSLIAAHLAMPVGPLAPDKTAINAMTTTLSNGCRRLTSDRGSSNSAK